jgi:hypothetical protein
MSALGHKRTFAPQTVMSALPPKADICSALAHVRFGPKADIGCLFDHLIRDRLETKRSRDTYCSSIIGLLRRKPMRAFS